MKDKLLFALWMTNYANKCLSSPMQVDFNGENNVLSQMGVLWLMPMLTKRLVQSLVLFLQRVHSPIADTPPWVLLMTLCIYMSLCMTLALIYLIEMSETHGD